MLKINRVYTKSGDAGMTSVLGGKRLPKDSPRIEAYGSVDELSSTVGLLRALILREATQSSAHKGDTTAQFGAISQQLAQIQNKLFDIGSDLATPTEVKKEGRVAIHAADVSHLEAAMDQWTPQLPELTSFVLPGGGLLSAQAHVARTVCRRIERLVLTFSREETVAPLILIYFNRLSDYFFVLSRYAGLLCGEEELLWKPGPA